MTSYPPACSQCGQPDAHDVGTETLCAGCLHERGSCGAVAEREADEIAAAPVPASPAPRPAREPGDRLRLNPNCCYQACASCSSLRRLREFRAQFPHDWASRVTGPERLQRLARECA